MSRTLLAQRLRSLERAGMVSSRPIPRRRGSTVRPDDIGQGTCPGVPRAWSVGSRWLDLAPEDYDPGVALWAWRKHLVPDRPPERRVVVRFDLRDRRKQRFWLLVDKAHVELCMKDPGFEVDLLIATDSNTLTRVHAGRLGLREAQRTGAWLMEGRRDLIRAFPTWGGLSYYANVTPVTASISA